MQRRISMMLVSLQAHLHEIQSSGEETLSHLCAIKQPKWSHLLTVKFEVDQPKYALFTVIPS